MLRRLAIAAVVVQTLACAEKPCSQNRITRGGALQPAEGDPIAAEYFPYGVEGEPLTGRIFAALTACEGDALRVWGDFTDEDGKTLVPSQVVPKGEHQHSLWFDGIARGIDTE